MKIIQTSILVVSMLIGISAHADTARKIGETLILNGFTEENNVNSSPAEELCIAGWRSEYDCIGVSSAGSAMCMGRGYDSYECLSISPSQAIAMKIKDLRLAWDMFRDQYGRKVWRCRGINTGQFADNDKCSSLTKNDDKWPN